MSYWLMKSEPSVFSFADLRAVGKRGEPWNGVRNYQARNFMRAMRVGERGLFYHSSCPEPGVAGVLRIVRAAYPDNTAWDPKSPYHDPAATPEQPRWDMVDVAWEAEFPTFVSLEMLRKDPALGEMVVLKRGNRLSVTPVTAAEFKRVCKLGGL